MKNIYNDFRILIFYLILILILSPIVKVSNFGFKLDLILSCFCFIEILLIPTFYFRKKIPLFFIITSLLLFVLMIISNNFGQIYISDFELSFPREFIQFLSRVSIFIFVFRIFYDGIIKTYTALKFISLFNLLVLVIGVVQINDILGLNNIFSNLYTANSNQSNAFLNSVNIRVFGVAGNPISWSGYSMLSFFFYLILTKSKKIKYLGIFLSIINMIFAASKSAIIGVSFTLFLLPLFKNFIYNNNFILLIKRYLILTSLIFACIYFFVTNLKENFFLIKRFEVFFNDGISQNTRFIQVYDAINLMFDYPFSFFIGLGKPIVYKILEYVEIEFFYLLVTYGFFGVLLHYLLLIIILYYSYRVRRVNFSYTFFIFCSTFSYLFFSIGFYFFRELNVGLSFWIINAILLSHQIRKNNG